MAEIMCDMCGLTRDIELHHKLHRADGGGEEPENLVPLCRICHDYQHAKDKVIKGIRSEEERLKVLRKRLALLEANNTPEMMRQRGYQSYFEFYKESLPRREGCRCP